MPSFAQASQGLAALRQEQRGLQPPFAAGELWMEADVAERAARRGEQQIIEVNERVVDLRPLGRERRFGPTITAIRSRGRSRTPRWEVRTALSGCYVSPRGVLRDMAQTFRHAGRAAAAAERANQQMFGGAQ